MDAGEHGGKIFKTESIIIFNDFTCKSKKESCTNINSKQVIDLI